MMTVGEINVDAKVEIEAPLGTVSIMRITELKDGKVTFARYRGKNTGRWWLPIDYVKQHGRLIQTPPLESAESARRG